jgi:hypothetical protein
VEPTRSPVTWRDDGGLKLSMGAPREVAEKIDNVDYVDYVDGRGFT